MRLLFPYPNTVLPISYFYSPALIDNDEAIIVVIYTTSFSLQLHPRPPTHPHRTHNSQRSTMSSSKQAQAASFLNANTMIYFFIPSAALIAGAAVYKQDLLPYAIAAAAGLGIFAFVREGGANAVAEKAGKGTSHLSCPISTTNVSPSMIF